MLKVSGNLLNGTCLGRSESCFQHVDSVDTAAFSVGQRTPPVTREIDFLNPDYEEYVILVKSLVRLHLAN